MPTPVSTLNEISSTGIVSCSQDLLNIPLTNSHNYVILINFSSFLLNLLYDETALKSERRVTRKNYMKRLENGIKDKSDESLILTNKPYLVSPQ